ncbi:hypothetical protein DIZ27_20635 [Streptomyces sp. NWU339]|nr:hypothetical protein DIZ27_20635 [Streptomyces sp. NWU339]
MQPSVNSPRPAAVLSASTTGKARWWPAVAQPVTSRAAGSMTVARYSQPARAGGQVLSGTGLVPGPMEVRSPPAGRKGDAPDAVLAHQPLDPPSG